MDFSTAVRTCLQKYVTFTGRAARSEYWYFLLFQFIALVAGMIIDSVLGTSTIVYGLVALALLLPALAAGVRRLHDTNRSGWWILLGLVPIIGAIVLIIWMCTKGTAGPNSYGEDPLPA
jgi:uncharacterized membrane protein YhaH (DUF805 family)